MIYEFRINNIVVSLEDFFDAVSKEVEADMLLAEIIETGSATVTRSWTVDTIYKVVKLEAN